MTLLSSCGQVIPPVFEVYATFENTEDLSEISIKPSGMLYGPFDKESKKPTGRGYLSIDRSKIYIDKENLNKKTFLTSISQSIGKVEYLTLESNIELKINDKSVSLFSNENNNVFPVDFEPKDGEAYEVNFIIDIKNSLVKIDNYFYLELGGDSRVEISKY